MSASEADLSDSNMESPFSQSDSPYSSPSQQVPQLANCLTELSCQDSMKHRGNMPYLQIVDQPQNHFRFRYKSEMVGTHGCLLGKSTASSKSKCHPSVELKNYTGKALIRCRLVRHDIDEEHPHRLLEDDQDGDVTSVLPEHGIYRVAFSGMGIIHTAKKDVAALLFQKYAQDKSIQLNENGIRLMCENEAKAINLNIVRLKFSAHDLDTNNEICPPVFSEPIHNMKSAATNDLKICRMSRCYGRPQGGDDVFIFVEKVNKKNIMIRFFELDEKGERAWSATFLQSDVHHQYAIVFRTPQYKDPHTPKDVKVYMELVRPSDGRTSEPKEFTYRAESIYKHRKKRKAYHSSYSSLESVSGGSIKSFSDVPLSVENVNNNNHFYTKNEDEIMKGVPVYTVPQMQQLAPTSDSMMADAILYDMGSTPGGALGAPLKLSPMLSQPNVPAPGVSGVPELQLHSSEMDRILERSIDPKRRFYETDLSGGLIKNFSDVPLSVENVNVPQMQQLAPTADSMMADAILYDMGSTPGGALGAPLKLSPMLSQPNVPAPGVSGVPELQLHSSEMDRILERSIEPEDKRRFYETDLSEYFKHFDGSISLDGMNEVGAMDILKCSMFASDSGRSKPVKHIEKEALNVIVEEESPKMHVKKNNAGEYSAVYKTDDGQEVKKLVMELCEIIRNKTAYKNQIVRGKLERLFEMRLCNGDTFLHMTLCSNQPSLEYIVKLIYSLKMTKLLNLKNNQMRTILHLAIINDSPKLVSFLVSKGCNPMEEDDEGNNAVHYAVICQSCIEPLLDAVKSNSVCCDINAYNNEKQSPLHLAVIYESVESAAVLLRHGASVQPRDSHDRTPLQLAATDDCLSVARLLVDAVPPSDIDIIDGKGYTALQTVCDGPMRKNTLEIAKLLLQKKADPNKHENCNQPAWKLARDKPELLELIQKHTGTQLITEDDIKSESEDELESEGEGSDEPLTELPLYMDELAALLDERGAWRELALRLNHGSHAWYSATPSPAKTLLKNLKESNDITSKSLALLLEDMGCLDAAMIVKKYLSD